MFKILALASVLLAAAFVYWQAMGSSIGAETATALHLLGTGMLAGVLTRFT